MTFAELQHDAKKWQHGYSSMVANVLNGMNDDKLEKATTIALDRTESACLSKHGIVWVVGSKSQFIFGSFGGDIFRVVVKESKPENY